LGVGAPRSRRVENLARTAELRSARSVQLPGRLERTTLGDVLGTLYRAELTGCLVLTDGFSGVHRIRLQGGRPTAVETSFTAPRLGELLLRQRNDPALRRTIERLGTCAEGPLGTRLLALGAIDARELQHALVTQTEARLEAVYRLKSASVRLSVREFTRRSRDELPLPPERYLYGRPRAAQLRQRSRRAPSPAPNSARLRALYLLGIEDAEATEQEIRRAFRGIAARLHPDRIVGATESERALLTRKFAEVTSAFHCLVR
jgi:DnaJ domain